MPTPVILITAGHKTPTKPYERAVELAGGEPLVYLPGRDPAELPAHAAGLVLTGGASVEPARYGAGIEPGVSPTMDLPRDELEFAILTQAQRRTLPVLGICRGFQLINVHYGGALHQDLTLTSYEAVHRPDASRDHRAHTVRTHGGRLAELLGDAELEVNSIHRQGVKRLGAGLLATVFAPDGLIEGIETPDGQIIAVQWHPEELVDDDPREHALFADLVERSQFPVRVPDAGAMS
jgi:putative glutamine amidotransferase